MERVEEQLTKAVEGRTVLDGIIREVVKQRREAYEKLEQSQQTPAPPAEEEQAAEQPTIPLETQQEEEEVRLWRVRASL